MKEIKLNDIAFSSLTAMARGLAQGDFTSVELTWMFLDRIARLDKKAHSYVEVYGESALWQAQAADLHRKSDLPVSPLHGLPIAVKDLCEIEGKITTAGSLAWKDRRSVVTSAVVERLQAAGMVTLGKVHTAEFAFSGWGVNPPMGTPRNPWDWTEHHRAPGGSSNGSAVAVAAGLAPAAIGSDTGGSVRIPAAFNGLTGLKTTYGLISSYGTVPLSVSLDSIGTLTRTAEDAAILTNALVGFDARDPLTHNRPQYVIDPKLAPPVRGLRIAVMPPEQYPWPVSDEVLQATEETVRVLRSLGAIIDYAEVPLDFPDMTKNNGSIIAADVYHYHAAYIEDPALPFGDALRQRVLRGKQISADMYFAMQEHRRKAIAIFSEWMRPYDLLLTPTVPFVACPLEEIDEAVTAPMAFTRAFNYLDTCGISLPAGFSRNGLPIGVQLIAMPWQENLLLRTVQEYQQVTDWHTRIPKGLD
jgi:aspartyl-tRNA(Asn)/glutamyl-tRNA(Gln) amidotransferase subunit A